MKRISWDEYNRALLKGAKIYDKSDLESGVPTTMQRKPKDWISESVLMDDHNLSLDHPKYTSVAVKLLNSGDMGIFTVQGANPGDYTFGEEAFSPKGIKILEKEGLVKNVDKLLKTKK